MGAANYPRAKAVELFHKKQFGLLREDDLMNFLPDGIFVARLSNAPQCSRWRLYSDMAKTYIPNAEAPTVRTLLIEYYRRES